MVAARAEHGVPLPDLGTRIYGAVPFPRIACR